MCQNGEHHPPQTPNCQVDRQIASLQPPTVPVPGQGMARSAVAPTNISSMSLHGFPYMPGHGVAYRPGLMTGQSGLAPMAQHVVLVPRVVAARSSYVVGPMATIRQIPLQAAVIMNAGTIAQRGAFSGML
ncbi:NAMPT [Symbiodinium sp. CCMP2592]|nr:NAMPT [Symbiodinium sp. CCMP2592]